MFGQRDYLKNGIGHLGYYLELPGSSEGQLLGAESGSAAYVDTYSLAKWVCLGSILTMLGATALSKAISEKIKVHMLVVRCKAEYCEPASRRKGGPQHNAIKSRANLKK